MSITKYANDFAKALDNYTQRLSTAGGQTEAELHVDNAGSIFGSKEDKDIVFVLPPGFRRHTFGSSTQKSGINAGGSINWANDNPYDATIRLHGWADAFSEVWIKCFDVLGIREG